MTEKCSQCGATFPTPEALERHQRKTHEETPKKEVKCSVCGMVFPSYTSLNEHTKDMHGE